MAKILTILIAVAFGFLLAAFYAFIVEYLWNECLTKAVDGVHAVSFWQAWGLIILSNLLFNGLNFDGKKKD